jgi:iron uptake system component EfeO
MLPVVGALALASTLAGCGGSAKQTTTSTTAKASASPSKPPRFELNQAAAGYKDYVEGESALLLSSVKQLAAALGAGNLDEAKTLYGPARAHYEAIEPVAERFGALDPAIDARAGDVPAAKWGGFHKIEQILWVQGTTAGSVPLANALVANVITLDSKVKTLTFQPVELANGSVELLNEVAKSKITGEEDRYSHTDLSDFQANLAGSRKAFQLLSPALAKEGEGPLVDYISTRFTKVQKDLDRFKNSTPLGFELYSAVTADDRRQFAQDVDAVAEPLSTVADKVNG